MRYLLGGYALILVFTGLSWWQHDGTAAINTWILLSGGFVLGYMVNQRSDLAHRRRSVPPAWRGLIH